MSFFTTIYGLWTKYHTQIAAVIVIVIGAIQSVVHVFNPQPPVAPQVIVQPIAVPTPPYPRPLLGAEEK